MATISTHTLNSVDGSHAANIRLAILRIGEDGERETVITGATADDPHPARRRLAGCAAGDIYDALLSVQTELTRGASGHEKPLSCSSSLLAKVATLPPDADALYQVLGERYSERFGQAFLNVLENR